MDYDRKDVRITPEGNICFAGFMFTDWAQIQWLRNRLAVMETNATALWGDERQHSSTVKHSKTSLTVIDGGKDSDDTSR